MAAIKAWCLWEARISRLHCQFDENQLVSDVHRAMSLAILECHYIKHHCFIPEGYILQNMEKTQLTIVPKSGHSAGEKLITQALCSASQAMDKFWQEQQ